MRLIDADLLIEAINKSTCNWAEHLWKRVVCDVIGNQPTAFDVENVVAELEYQKEQCEKDMKYYEEKSWKDHISHTNYDLFYAKSDCWEDAIDIVKRGVCDD